MHNAWAIAKVNTAKAQAKKQRDVNKHRRPATFEVGDKVWVKTLNWHTDRPSQKLSNQMAGPWKIIEKVGFSYRLGLPISMRIHNVFPASNLRLDPDNALPGQINDLPPPIQITGDNEYEVQQVIAVRLRQRKLQYRAAWVGADEDPEWYPASDFKYSPQLLKSFHLANPTLPGPPAKLTQWLKLYKEGIDNYNYLDDDSLIVLSSRASFFERGCKE